LKINNKRQNIFFMYNPFPFYLPWMADSYFLENVLRFLHITFREFTKLPRPLVGLSNFRQSITYFFWNWSKGQFAEGQEQSDEA